MKCDYLIVGSGLTGSTIARLLTDAGRDVLVLDRRAHMGGNVHDHIHALSGITVHTYGPHYFRTSSDRIWEFVNRFSDFYKYEAGILSKIDSDYYHWPVWRSEFDRLAKGQVACFHGEPKNLEEAALKLMPRRIYELFVKEYNEKQWGVSATTLDRELCSRFDVRDVDDPRLKPEAKHQGLPTIGYAGMMMRMLSGIRLELGVDYLRQKDRFQAKHVVFTGPIDEYFDFSLGKLAYRGQRRDHKYHQTDGFIQPTGQVNYPRHIDGRQIRSLEWKHMMKPGLAARGSVVTTETPYSPILSDEYEYPFPDRHNRMLYESYRTLVEGRSDLTIAGRLGEYKYLDMDQAIGRAMKLVETLVEK
jgi:UDP-galactopyranose mutase